MKKRTSSQCRLITSLPLSAADIDRMDAVILPNSLYTNIEPLLCISWFGTTRRVRQGTFTEDTGNRAISTLAFLPPPHPAGSGQGLGSRSQQTRIQVRHRQLHPTGGRMVAVRSEQEAYGGSLDVGRPYYRRRAPMAPPPRPRQLREARPALPPETWLDAWMGSRSKLTDFAKKIHPGAKIARSAADGGRGRPEEPSLTTSKTPPGASWKRCVRVRRNLRWRRFHRILEAFVCRLAGEVSGFSFLVVVFFLGTERCGPCLRNSWRASRSDHGPGWGWTSRWSVPIRPLQR